MSDDAQRAELTRSAIAVMDLMGEGATAVDVLDLSPATDVVDGMRHYANYLEAVLVAVHKMPVPEIRAAALRSADKLAARG